MQTGEMVKHKAQVTMNSDSQYEKAKKRELIKLGGSDKPYKDILSYLNNEIAMSTKMAEFNHKILCFKNDGVYQLNRAIEEIYGVSQAKAGQKPSGGGDKPIATLEVQLADGTKIHCTYGTIELPDFGDGATIDIGYNSKTNMLYIQGQCQFRYASTIDAIIDRTKQLLNTESIYKGQALELGTECKPTILDLSSYDTEFMVLSSNVEYELRPLMARIQQPDKCKANGIPLRYGVLLEGNYGEMLN